MSQNAQISLWITGEKYLIKKQEIIKDIIVDRKSKYTLVVAYIENREDIQDTLKELNKDPYFRKSTHNSYAYRIKQENGSIIDGKNDDGETWAGMCILREIQRANYVNCLIVVTRYFWGIKLNADRFKNVIDACKIYFEGDFIGK